MGMELEAWNMGMKLGGWNVSANVGMGLTHTSQQSRREPHSKPESHMSRAMTTEKREREKRQQAS